jgi:expansin (peptidoglycan-binding protein)
MILQCAPDSFKSELISGTHAFSTDTFKCALYASTADLNNTTTVYTATGEATGSGYSAGGITLTGVTISTDNQTTYVDWADVSLAGMTVTARGAMIYNSSKSNKAVLILDFGLDIPFVSGGYTSIVLPHPNFERAILRIR